MTWMCLLCFQMETTDTNNYKGKTISGLEKRRVDWGVPIQSSLEFTEKFPDDIWSERVFDDKKWWKKLSVKLWVGIGWETLRAIEFRKESLYGLYRGRKKDKKRKEEEIKDGRNVKKLWEGEIEEERKKEERNWRDEKEGKYK